MSKRIAADEIWLVVGRWDRRGKRSHRGGIVASVQEEFADDEENDRDCHNDA